MARQRLPRWLAPALAGGAFAVLALAETRWPLRTQREPRLRRTRRNLTLAASSAVAVAVLERFIAGRLASRVEARRLGILQKVRLPPPARPIAGFLLLDYTLWWWHRMNHQLPALWRFHLVHHADPDMDASTALRFHAGEMSLSVFFRAAQIRLLGIDRFTTSLWQLLLSLSVLFHHANLRLPRPIDDGIATAIVTPRMHGIHHSIIPAERNTNFSSILTIWDRLHATLLLDRDQGEITIGLQ